MKQNYSWGPFKKKPNILLIVTDQQREIRHFPEGWAEEHLPALTWLKNNGISFTRGYANASPCTPSRGILFSGLFQSLTGVWVIGDSLPYNTKTIGYMMDKKGYHAIYKGKWHLDYDFSQDPGLRPPKPGRMKREDKRMEERYHFKEWTSPDSAGATATPHLKDDCTGSIMAKIPASSPPPWKPGDPPNDSSFNCTGGGTADNDGRYVHGPLFGEGQESAVEFLQRWQGKDDPFFMVVSLSNPHDVAQFPNNFKEAGYSMANIQGEAYKDFKLPPNFEDSLDMKPTDQKKSFHDFNKCHFDLNGKDGLATALDYIKFYAFAHTRSDKLIMEIIETLKKTNQLENTIIVRVADHGEMAFSHKLRGKCHNIYEETIHIPVIFSNPRLVKECYGGKPVQSEKLVSLVDIMPTLASIAGWTEEEIKKDGKLLHGVDISKTILDLSQPTQDYILLAQQGRSPLAPKDRDNDNIRAVIDGKWKYGVYFIDANDPAPQYEMYNLKEDPGELNNLLYTPGPEEKEQAKIMHEKLTGLLERTDMAPLTWDDVPSYKKWRRTGFNIIKNMMNGLVLDIKDASTEKGTPIIGWSPKQENNDSQLWEITENGFIKSKLNSCVLEIKGRTNMQGAPIMVWPLKSKNNADQLWTITENGLIKNNYNNFVLTVGKEGELVKLWPERSNDKSQLWDIIPQLTMIDTAVH
jgi:choline-sulfatase